jgi:hypothetical protein
MIRGLMATFTAVGLAGALWTPSATASPPGWSVVPSPSPIIGGQNYLDGVSCSSGKSCTAVGSYEKSKASLALAEGWNGTSWTIQSTPTVTGVQGSVLYDVSCSSATACMAVGDSYKVVDTGYYLVTLAEKWNGAIWTVVPTPNQTGYPSALSRVSCTSSKACTAVGGYLIGSYTLNDYLTLVERWNGKSWKIQKTPTPPGSQQTGLGDVSCVSAKLCLATGSSRIGGTPPDYSALAERWNGTRWKILRTPSLGLGVSNSEFGGVSCTSSKACVALVDYKNRAGVAVTITERFNGTKWKITPGPKSAHGYPLELGAGLSCATAKVCIAAGSYTLSWTTGRPGAERWNGRSWAFQAASSPSINGLLNGVSCATARSCFAVGWYIAAGGIDVSLAERYT